MSPLEAQILQQIAQLQTTMGGNKPTVAPQTTIEQANLSVEDVVKIARQVFVEELAVLKDSTPEVNEAKEVSPLVSAINAGLTAEERIWLFNPERLQHVEEQLPKFLLTEDGKLAIQSFIIYFRGLYEN